MGMPHVAGAPFRIENYKSIQSTEFRPPVRDTTSLSVARRYRFRPMPTQRRLNAPLGAESVMYVLRTAQPRLNEPSSIRKCYREFRHDHQQIADETVTGHVEDLRFLVLVNRDDDLRGQMLDRTRNASPRCGV